MKKKQKDQANPLMQFSKPKNIAQGKLIESLNNKHHKIVIAYGPAGTGKTLLCVENCLKSFFDNKYSKIIFTRPIVAVDEDMGYLPGTAEEKMSPWMRPIFDILMRFLNGSDIQSYLDKGIIEISPLGFMRGRTFENTYIIADEMQNATINQMKMLLTRVGKNTKLTVTGDLEQIDLKKDRSGLEDFLDKNSKKRSSSISSIEFDAKDVERENVVKDVLEIYASSNFDNYINTTQYEKKNDCEQIYESSI